MPVATCYRFLRCQVHRDFDDVQGWFLEVSADDPKLLEALHRSIATKYRLMFGEDAHCKVGLADATSFAANWLRSFRDELQKGGVLVNPAGGFVAKRDLIVLEEVDSEDLTWPVCFADEIITISRWPRGKHYYLCSNKGRVFMPDKFSTYGAAREAALKYVSANRIRSGC
jgi:hypothetical protein